MSVSLGRVIVPVTAKDEAVRSDVRDDVALRCGPVGLELEPIGVERPRAARAHGPVVGTWSDLLQHPTSLQRERFASAGRRELTLGRAEHDRTVAVLFVAVGPGAGQQLLAARLVGHAVSLSHTIRSGLVVPPVTVSMRSEHSTGKGLPCGVLDELDPVARPLQSGRCTLVVMTERAPRSAVDRFLSAVCDGAVGTTSDVYASAVRLDATVPGWRFAAIGDRAVKAEYARWFAHRDLGGALPAPDGRG